MSNKKSYHEWNPSWKNEMDLLRYTVHKVSYVYIRATTFAGEEDMKWYFSYFSDTTNSQLATSGVGFGNIGVISRFNNMKKDFSDQLLILRKRMQEYTTDPSEVVKQVEILNQIIDSIEVFNNLLIARVKISDDKHKFLDHFKITEDQLTGYRLHDMDTDVMRGNINKIIDENFDDILTAYKQTRPEPAILKHDNSTTGNGRHISPGIVNVTDVIAVNLTCDVIDGSYSASENSATAQQEFILYSFTPREPPGYLIVQEPINPVFLRCHNPWLSRINFKLTNQSGDLLDIQNETLTIYLLVKS